jgi:nicotinamide-nucleotide amidase
MYISVIAIGDELLIGQVVDTNSGDIARRISPMGWSLRRVEVVADSPEEITSALDRELEVSQVVILTGGLGPTKDDITKKTLCGYFGGKMKHDPDVLENIKEVFSKRGLNLNTLTEGQAMVPDVCTVIQNKFGTAPVMWFERDGKVVVSMPGVPFETRGMLDIEVLPRLRRRFAPDMAIAHHTLMVTDITESDLAILLDGFESSLPDNLHLAYLPTPGLIRLRLDGVGRDADELKRVMAYNVAVLKNLVGECVLHDGDATPAEIVIGLLKEKGLTLSTAESCTGGTVASRLTSVPGASEVYMGSVVSYSNDVKSRVLGVNEDVLVRNGAVSQPVVEAMALGVTGVCGTDCAIATSGIAGPGGGSAEKPVGTVWISVNTPSGLESKVYHFPGDRTRVVDRATTVALVTLAKSLKKDCL